MHNFNNPDIHIQSWYIACHSKELLNGNLKTIRLCGKNIVVYRDRYGVARAALARCPHLGADLGKGTVEGEGLRCAFHHWEFGVKGSCVHAPGYPTVPLRTAFIYPTQEKWGYIWIWNGPEALFELPTVLDHMVQENYRVIRMPSQLLRCHPHVMIMNGLDVEHFSSLHEMNVWETKLEEFPPYNVMTSLTGEPTSKFLQLFMGTKGIGIDASFETIGGHIALATVRKPIQFFMLFTGNTTENGFCRTHTIAFLPKGSIKKFVQSLASMYVLLHDDRRILDDIEFTTSFAERDEPLMAFVKGVNTMSVW